MSRTAHTYNDDIALSSPERCLLAAIIKQALSDALRGHGPVRADAHAYLAGPNFEADAAWLDLDPAYVRKLLKENPMADEPAFAAEPAPEPARGRRGAPALSEQTVRALHARHVHPDAPESAVSLAREAGVTVTTLSKSFKRFDLPVVPRPGTGPRRQSKPAQAAGDLAGGESDNDPADNDAWFERVRFNPTDVAALDHLDNLFAGDETFLSVPTATRVEDPRGLEQLWRRAHAHRPADEPTLDELLAPPTAIVPLLAAWAGRLRAVREELAAMGVRVDGAITISIDL